jgi:hypothetical protein
VRPGGKNASALVLAVAACFAAVACVSASPAEEATAGPAALVVHFVAVEGEPVVGGRQVGELFGCADHLVAVDSEKTTAAETVEERITAALAAQFAAKAQAPDGLYDALARSVLRVDRVEPVPALPGAYRVHLGGNLRLGGACDTPRVREQLEATATQFPEVEMVEIFLGDEPLDAAMASRGRE